MVDSSVWPGVCNAFIITLPSLNSSLSFAIWVSYVVEAPGPKIMVEFVDMNPKERTEVAKALDLVILMAGKEINIKDNKLLSFNSNILFKLCFCINSSTILYCFLWWQPWW